MIKKKKRRAVTFAVNATRERYSGSCSRSFYVGEHIREEDIDAKFENGILQISVPKKAPEVPVQKQIAIK